MPIRLKMAARAVDKPLVSGVKGGGTKNMQMQILLQCSRALLLQMSTVVSRRCDYCNHLYIFNSQLAVYSNIQI